MFVSTLNAPLTSNFSKRLLGHKFLPDTCKYEVGPIVRQLYPENQCDGSQQVFERYNFQVICRSICCEQLIHRVYIRLEIFL